MVPVCGLQATIVLAEAKTPASFVRTDKWDNRFGDIKILTD